MAERLALIVALLALAGWSTLRPRKMPAAPPLIPVAQAEVWMVDALPGIGPKRRDAALAAVRDGRLATLPKAAAVMAGAVFMGVPPGAGIDRPAPTSDKKPW